MTPETQALYAHVGAGGEVQWRIGQGSPWNAWEAGEHPPLGSPAWEWRKKPEPDDSLAKALFEANFQSSWNHAGDGSKNHWRKLATIARAHLAKEQQEQS